MRIERFRWWHVEEVLPIERELFQPDPWSAHHFWTELGQTDTRSYVVGLVGEQLAGYAGLCDYPDEAFVQTIGVATTHQGRGYGALLLDHLLTHVPERKPVVLEVRSDNVAAHRLYDSRGFRRTGVRRGYYPGGVDAFVLTRKG